MPLVPSVTVRCFMCGAACWLSARTGAGTLTAASRHGQAEIVCNQCLQELAGQGLEITVRFTRAAADEARGAVN